MLFLPVTTHNANRHCRVRFYALCGTTFVETAVFATANVTLR